MVLTKWRIMERPRGICGLDPIWEFGDAEAYPLCETYSGYAPDV